MQNLSDSLTNLNPRQKLLVLRGGPVEVLPLVWKEWGITHLVFEKVCPVFFLVSVIYLIFGSNRKDTAAYARQRDAQILDLIKTQAPHIKVIVKHGHNLYDPELVVSKGNAGKAITTLNGWKKVSLSVSMLIEKLRGGSRAEFCSADF